MKKRYTISIDENLGNWLENSVESKRFRNVSHGFEFCVNEVHKKENTKSDSNDTNQPAITRENILDHVDGYVNDDSDEDNNCGYSQAELAQLRADGIIQ